MGSSSIKFSICPSNMVEAVWCQISGLLEPVVALSHGETSLDTILEDLISGNQGLIVVTDGPEVVAAITTQFRDFDTGKRVLYMPNVGGVRMSEWLDELIVILKRMAAQGGASEIRGYMARKGWSKVLMDDRDWDPVYQVMSCKVEDSDERK